MDLAGSGWEKKSRRRWRGRESVGREGWPEGRRGKKTRRRGKTKSRGWIWLGEEESPSLEGARLRRERRPAGGKKREEETKSRKRREESAGPQELWQKTEALHLGKTTNAVAGWDRSKEQRTAAGSKGGAAE
ncbi:hypothetical protein ACLOJK_028169 [Asimina triloba]